MSARMQPRAPDAAAGGVGNAQSLKVRRLEQTLFLREMERLADAMCRHYIDARPDVDPVAPDDIRGHVDTIHDRVHHAIEKDLKPDNTRIYRGLDGATAIPLDRFDHDGVADADVFGLQGSSSHHRPAHPHSKTSARAGARPQAPKEEWTAQETRGVSLRLRNMTSVSVASQRQYRAAAHPPPTVIQPDEAPMMTVSRFATEDPSQLALLDMNMDNNTACLSARKRPNPATNTAELLETAMRTKTEKSWGDSHKPRAPARFPRERLPVEPAASMEEAAQRTCTTMVRGTSGAKPVWSPRDAVSIAARKPRQPQGLSPPAASSSTTTPRLPALHPSHASQRASR